MGKQGGAEFDEISSAPDVHELAQRIQSSMLTIPADCQSPKCAACEQLLLETYEFYSHDSTCIEAYLQRSKNFVKPHRQGNIRYEGRNVCVLCLQSALVFPSPDCNPKRP
jgi:hypothetical protein